jgi:hypothetical protein
LTRAEQVAGAGDDHVAHHAARDHLLQRERELVEHDDDLRARVAQLVRQFARRVQRVDVDHRVARAQHGGHGDRILQQVRQHHRHARARLQAPCAQPGGEAARQPVDVGIRQHAAHAGIGRTLGVFFEGFVQQMHQRAVLRRVYGRRDVLRV